jgi:hypothetical protein
LLYFSWPFSSFALVRGDPEQGAIIGLLENVSRVPTMKTEQFPAGTNLSKNYVFRPLGGSVARTCNACRKLFTGTTRMLPA